MTENSSPSQAVSSLTVILHWLLAFSVLFLFVSSWWMLSLPLPSDEFTYRVLPFQLHKNMGITVFVFAVLMTIQRVSHRPPTTVASKIQKLATIDHLLIYLLLLVCCLSGYLSSSYSGWTTSFWWLVNLPNWTAENDELNMVFSDIHLWACWALLAVISIHIAAALYHAFSNDGFIDKMFGGD